MAVTGGRRSNALYIGLSTDQKPTGASVEFAAQFYEQDTGKTYIWTGTAGTTNQAINPNAGINQWIEYLPLCQAFFDPNPLAPAI
jgi:hypothetical protein